MFDKINTVFGLWPSTKNSAKPFFLESFTTFGKAVYPLFLLYTVSITIFDLTSCDFNGLAASSQGMAESMCLMESAFSVRVEDIHGWGEHERPSMSPVTEDSPVYTTYQAWKTGETYPGVSAVNTSSVHSTQYRRHLVYALIDAFLLLQLFLFWCPEHLWLWLQWYESEASEFRFHDNWDTDSISCDLEWSTEDLEEIIKYREAMEKKDAETRSELDELYNEWRANCGGDYKRLFELAFFSNDSISCKLFDAARSNYVSNLIVIILAQLAGILVMTLIWDWVFAFGTQSHNFSFLGIRVIDFWLAYYRANGKLPFNVVDPLEQLFPRVVKCHFDFVGPTGEVSTNDILCVLPGNVIMEKLFLVIWGFYVMSICKLSYAAVVKIGLPSVRWWRIRGLRALLHHHNVPARTLRKIRKHCCVESEADVGQIPYKVAVFIQFLSERIGTVNAANSLKRFTYAISHGWPSLDQLKEEIARRKTNQGDDAIAAEDDQQINLDLFTQHYLEGYHEVHALIDHLGPCEQVVEGVAPFYVSDTEDEAELESEVEKMVLINKVD